METLRIRSGRNWSLSGLFQLGCQRFRASPLSARLAKGVVWSLIGAIIARGAGVVASIIVARLLGITAFGEFTVIQSTVGLFGTFAGMGLGVTATKYVAELRDSDPVRCGRIIGLVLTTAVGGGVIAAAGLVWLGPWLAAHTLAAPQLAPWLQWGALLVVFGTLQGVYSGVLSGFEAFKRVAKVNWLAALLGTPLVVLATYSDGLRGAVWGSALQLAVGCLLGHVALVQESARAGIRVRWGVLTSDLGVLWSFSVPAFLSSALAGPANWACNTLLVNQDTGYNEVALLNAAGQWRNFLIFLPMTMTTVLLPIFANLYRTGNRAELMSLLRRNLLINAGVSLALALPVALLGATILGWYGPGFQNGIVVFVLAMLGTAVVGPSNLLSRAMQATGRAWLEFSFSALWAILLVSLCVALIPAHKALGLTIAHICAAAALAVWQWLIIRRLTSSKVLAVVPPLDPVG